MSKIKNIKPLKKWNGRAQGNRRGSFYVAAYSQKQAAELIGKAGGYNNSSVNEIRKYYSQCWGNPMDGIEPTEPCVYYAEHWEKPKRIL
jgi:hypothetical protein